MHYLNPPHLRLLCQLGFWAFSWILLTTTTLLGNEEWIACESDALPPDNSVVWNRLDNGLRYALMPNAEPPGRVSLRLYVGAGSLMELDEQQGLAHFLEHMAFNGTRHFAPGEMVEYFQRIGMAFGADTNAHTSFDETVYKIELPYSDPELIEDGLRVLRDYADGMLLLEEEIQNERGVILSEKRTRDSARYREFVAKWQFLFPETLLSQRFPIGKEDVIENAPRSAFLDFYEKWYTADRMALVVVGEVDVAEWSRLIRAYFGDLPGGTFRPNPDLGVIEHPGINVRLHTEPEAQAVQVSLQTVQPFAPQSDTRTRRLRELYRSIAYEILSHRLRVLSKQLEASFYEGEAYAFDYLDFCEVGAVVLRCQPSQWEAAVATVEQVVRGALSFGFTESETQVAGAKVFEAFKQAAKSAATRRSKDLADDLVRSISEQRVFMHPQDELELVRSGLDALTPEKCHAAFSELWTPSDRYLFVSGDLNLENAETQLLETFHASSEVALTPPEETPEIPFAYTSGSPGRVVTENFVEDLGIYQLHFANNVRLNFKPTDFEAHTLHIGVRFGGGKLEALPEQPGLSLLAETAFIEGGLGAHSTEDWERILAGNNVSVEFTVEDDAFILNATTTPEDLLLQLQLLCAYLTDPGYREESLKLARQNLEALYRQLSHTGEGVIKDHVAHFLATGDFRFGFPPREEALAKTLDELKDWLRYPLSEGYLEISIVGDGEPAAVKAAVAATLGALPQRSGYKPSFTAERNVHFPQNIHNQSFQYLTELPRALAAVYWPTTDISDIHRTRRLNLLARVFSDRLRLHIREENGEGYSPYALNEPSDTYPGYGLFYGISLTRPEQVGSVAAEIKAIGTQLAHDGLTADEHQRALRPILNFIKTYVRDNTYWLKVVLMRSQENPERLEWARTLYDEYQKITLEELNLIAQEFLDSERALVIEVIP